MAGASGAACAAAPRTSRSCATSGATGAAWEIAGGAVLSPALAGWPAPGAARIACGRAHGLGKTTGAGCRSRTVGRPPCDAVPWPGCPIRETKTAKPDAAAILARMARFRPADRHPRRLNSSALTPAAKISPVPGCRRTSEGCSPPASDAAELPPRWTRGDSWPAPADCRWRRWDGIGHNRPPPAAREPHPEQ